MYVVLEIRFAEMQSLINISFSSLKTMLMSSVKNIDAWSLLTRQMVIVLALVAMIMYFNRWTVSSYLSVLYFLVLLLKYVVSVCTFLD